MKPEIAELLDLISNLSTISLKPRLTELDQATCFTMLWLGYLLITSVLMSWVQFSSATQSCPTLCNPMDCSTPGLPVHHQLPELAQTLVHWLGDAIQPSHPLSSPSPPALNLSQHQGLFKWVSRWGERWEGESGWETHVNPWLIHVNVWQKPLQYCKVISLQLIKINGKKKKRLSLSHQVAKVLEFQLQHKSFQWTPRTDLL